MSKTSLYDKVLNAIESAKKHNAGSMTAPEVVLWTDPDRQWETVIPVLQEYFPQFLIYGSYQPEKKTGPAIWLKTVLAKKIKVGVEDAKIPIIYLPGVAKNDFKNVEQANLLFQPLLEYQYTGVFFTQENGKDWTVLAFLQNSTVGMGLKVSQDGATKDSLIKTLPLIFQDSEALYTPTIIDSTFLSQLLFPNIHTAMLKWMCQGNDYLNALEEGQRETFKTICKRDFDFVPDPKNIKAIAEMLGSQRGAWRQVWQHYANAPTRYPEVPELLRLGKPDDLGKGMFVLPEESWPQVNEEREEKLLKDLSAVAELQPKEALQRLKELETVEAVRRKWVWSELGFAPMVNILPHLIKMAEECLEPYPSTTINDLRQYYETKGFVADQKMRATYALCRTEKQKKAIKNLIHLFYKPWLEDVNLKFQKLVQTNADIFLQEPAMEEEEYVLFVDAFRFELAKEFFERLTKQKYKVELYADWSAIPSVTPTCKPAVSPIAMAVSTVSACQDFRPQLKFGKDLQTTSFREAMSTHHFSIASSGTAFSPDEKYWQEIGDIDKKGHDEQADVVRRVEELFDKILEVIELTFSKGVNRIKVVTDHGWLLLPGGLPKQELNKNLVETRWGRCATIKEGAKTELMYLPWRWNTAVFIAYAPGISFFKKNEEYAHGGISLHECLIPTLIVEKATTKKSEGRILNIKWLGLRCTVTTEGATEGFNIDIRTKFNEASTSIVITRTAKRIEHNVCSLLVDDAAEGNAATVVLLDENDVILDKQLTQVGG